MLKIINNLNKNNVKSRERERESKSPFFKIPPLLKGARGIFKVILTSLIAALACTGIIYAATTVGTNISTGGTLTVTGTNTFYGATTIGGVLTATSTLTVTGLTILGNASTTILSVSGNTFLATTTMTGNLILDVTNTEAFLIRKDEDSGNVFVVDSSGNKVLIGEETNIAAIENAEYVKVGGVLRAIRTKDGAGNTVRIDLFHDANITDYCLEGTVGSIEWAEDQLTNGGLIHLSAGDFQLDGTSNTTACTFETANLIIEGEGKDTRMFPIANQDISNGISILADNVTLKDFFMDGGHQYNTPSNCTDAGTCYGIDYLILSIEVGFTIIDNLDVENAGTDGIVNHGSWDYTAINNRFNNIRGNEGGDQSSALEVEDGAYRATYINNTILNSTTCMFPHVHDTGSGTVGQAVSNIKFIGTTCIAGAEANSVSEVTFNDNDINGEGETVSSVQIIGTTHIGEGITVGHDMQGEYKVDIQNVTIIGSADDGVVCSQSGQVNVTGCTNDGGNLRVTVSNILSSSYLEEGDRLRIYADLAVATSCGLTTESADYYVCNLAGTYYFNVDDTSSACSSLVSFGTDDDAGEYMTQYPTTHECNIVGGRITDSTDYAVRFTGGIDGVVEGLRIDGTVNNHCVSLESGKLGGNVTVMGNTLSGCGDGGIHLSGGNGIQNIVSNTLIGTDIELGAGGSAKDAYWNVSSNVLTGGGIIVDNHSNFESLFMVINGNIMEGGGGIDAGNTGIMGHGVISNNIIRSSADDGILSQGAFIISGNFIYESQNSGIFARYDSTISDYKLISNNVIYNSNRASGFDHGIYVQGDNFLIDGNRIVDTTDTSSYGIWDDANNTNGVISNNYIEGGGTGFMISGDNYNIHNNTLLGQSGFAYRISDGANNIIIHDNRLDVVEPKTCTDANDGTGTQEWDNYPSCQHRPANGDSVGGVQRMDIYSAGTDIDFTLMDGVKHGQTTYIYASNVNNCSGGCVVTVTHCDADGDADGDCTLVFDATTDKVLLKWNEWSGTNADPAANSPEWEVQPNYTIDSPTG